GAGGRGAGGGVGGARVKAFGPFGGRGVGLVFARTLPAVTVARIAIAALPASFLLLLVSAGGFTAIVAFTLLMGASQGVITIVRGAVPLALFGSHGYGAVLGVLATPILIVNAVSPTLFAAIVDRWGGSTGQTVLMATSAGSCAAMELMARWYRRSRLTLR